MSTHAPARVRIFHEILDEHRDCAEFALELFEDALRSPMRNLEQVSRHPERALVAHLDALVLAGGAAPALLREALVKPDPERPAATAVAAFGLVETAPDEVLAALVNPAARVAVVRGVHLSGNGAFVQRLFGDDPSLRDAGLSLCAELHVPPPVCLDVLQSDEPKRICVALTAIRHADSGVYRGVVEWLLAHDDPEVHCAAWIVSAAWGDPFASHTLERRGLARCTETALALYACLGGRRQHARLLELLSQPDSRAKALFALGFSGNAEMMPSLYPFLESAAPFEAKLALQSLTMIAGLDLDDEALLKHVARPSAPALLPDVEDDPEARAALPPLEEDDLNADIVPPPELELPDVAVEVAIARCELLRARAAGRQLAGVAYSRARVAEYLAIAPMRQRTLLALATSVRARGAAWVDARAFTRTQRKQTEVLCQALPARLVELVPW